MSAGRSWSGDRRALALPGAIRTSLREGGRYFLASAVALAIDAGVFIGLARIVEVPYLLAAPVAFALGVAVIYALSIRWVFAHRRIANARVEFAVFLSIGIAGLLVNQGILYVGIEFASLSFELAKLVSAGAVFCFNFLCRKLLLFTRVEKLS